MIERTTKAKTLHPALPVCKRVELEVVAVDAAVPWTSDPSNSIEYARPPSKTQTCATAPKLTLPQRLTTSLKGAKRAHWIETLRFRAAGVGTLAMTLTYTTRTGASSTVTKALKIRRRGTHVLHVALPSGVRAAGSGSLRLRETAPDGRHHRTRIVKIEVSA